jgi:DNA-binding transcriptional MerR regulator
MYSIGDLARLGGVSVRMLRHYDEIGVVRPAEVSPSTGYRRYGPAELLRLHRAVALKELGFSLADIARLLDEQISTDELRGMLRLRLAQLADHISRSQDQLRRVELRIASIDKEETMSARQLTDNEVTMRSIPEVLVAEAVGIAPGFEPGDIGPVIQPLYDPLLERIVASGFDVVGPSIAYYEDAPDGDGIRVAATFPVVTHGRQPVDGISVVTLQAIEQAVCVIHHGSMDSVDDTYMAVIHWLDQHNLETIGYSREVYLSCPEDLADWITELQYAVRPRR